MANERSARLRAENEFKRFQDRKTWTGRVPAVVGARKAAKVGTWVGLAELLAVLPADTSASGQIRTVKSWARAVKRSKGGDGSGKAAQVAEALLSTGSDVLSDPAVQAALTSAGVPPQVASGLASVFDALVDDGVPAEQAAALTSEMAVSTAEDAGFLGGLWSDAKENPGEAAALALGAALAVYLGVR